MYGLKYWYGKEVEGRYSDIDTVFVREVIPDNYKEYPHIYFTIEYINRTDWIDIHNILKTKQVVTIESNDSTMNKIPMSVFNRVHIIYRMQDVNVSKLKKTDTISIDTDWYRVHQIMKDNLMEITPDDYKFDRIKE